MNKEIYSGVGWLSSVIPAAWVTKINDLKFKELFCYFVSPSFKIKF